MPRIDLNSMAIEMARYAFHLFFTVYVCGECAAVSHHGYCHSESQIILFGSMTNIRIFTGKCHLNK